MIVTGTVLFGSVCEMLMPRGGLRKFVLVTLGILITFAIAQPLISISDDDFSFGEIKTGQLAAGSYVSGTDEEYKFQLIKTYRKNLNEKIESTIAEKDPAITVDINVEVEIEDEKSFGNINRVSAVVSGDGGKNPESVIYSALESFGVSDRNVDIKYIRQRGGV